MYISARTTGRGVLAGGVVSGLMILATACASVSGTGGTSSGSVGAGSTGSGGAVAATTAPPIAATTAAAGGSGATAAAGGPGACATRDLSAKAGQSQGTAGSTYVDLVFTNISNSTCTVYGYPGVSLAAGTPVTQIGLSATESTTSPRQLVTLAPGAVASALLQIVDAGNFPPATCAPVNATYLQIYPPNQTTPIYLAFSSQTCSKPVQTLTIGVMKPGADAS